MNEIKISIRGLTNTGKSTIIYLINKYLKENGWNVELTQSVLNDYGNEEIYLEKLGKTIDKRIKSLQPMTLISVVEETCNRKIITCNDPNQLKLDL